MEAEAEAEAQEAPLIARKNFLDAKNDLLW